MCARVDTVFSVICFANNFQSPRASRVHAAEAALASILTPTSSTFASGTSFLFYSKNW